ncbi:MAG: dienelactone hydrolase family protein [Planctomycetaceae bacterium]|nr:dienelactone hydrolase family protein [Planctomycetaceae bacterium]
MSLSALFVCLSLWSADPLPAGDHQRSLEVDGRSRKYLVHVPPETKRPKVGDQPAKWPVVLVFHGGGSNAEVMVRFSGMSEKADEAGFVAVYPSGSGRLEKVLTFNGGNCCGYAQLQKIDDVAFTRALLDDLAKALPIDEKRVFATGMSNGGIISYRLASELSDRVAAIAPVGGPMGTETCQPKRPVPVMHFHGIDDKYAPFQGGRGEDSLTGTKFYSVEHSINAWVKANGCDEKPAVTELPDKTDDGTRVTRKVWSNGREGSEVILFEIQGGGHTWPGRPAAVRFLGTTTRDINANDLMWEFFQRHPMK